MIDLQQLQKQYQERFEAMSDQELVDAFNREVGNSGWGSARAVYIVELHRAFESHGFDYSIIGDQSGLCFKRRIRLLGKRFVCEDANARDAGTQSDL